VQDIGRRTGDLPAVKNLTVSTLVNASYLNAVM
jgi:hypothetical protein